jgi:peptidoglycan-N-acetylglucosamine deacetylase
MAALDPFSLVELLHHAQSERGFANAAGRLPDAAAGSAPVHHRRAQMIDMNVKWPDGARVAVMLTFDFDAETLWMSRDADKAMRRGVLSQGRYGANVGVPMILDTLNDAGVPATFFVPGWTAENHTGRVEMIVKAGHEIGHHSYSHRWTGGSAEEVEEMEKGLEALKRTVGVVPKGYRSPAGEAGENLFALLNQHGFLYDSSLLDHINPYRHTMPDGSRGPIELPWHWSLDDAPFALFSIKSPRPIFTNQHISRVFQDEFREIYRWGGLFDLVMDPQVTGRPSRIALLREMIALRRCRADIPWRRGSRWHPRSPSCRAEPGWRRSHWTCPPL